MPEGTLVQTVSRAKFLRYKEALSGLNDSNMPEVMAKIINLGLTPGGGVMQRVPGALDNSDALGDTRM